MRCLTVALLALLIAEPVPAWKNDIVRTWARDVGEELWKLNEALTKSDQIRLKYKQMNASVKKKDGKQILESSLRSVSTMLTRKINAVKCIHATAERLAREFNYTMIEDTEFDQEFTYCSAKYSNFEYEPDVEPPEEDEDKIPRFAKNNPHYLNLSLERDSHFYDISVNTNTSCVHVPTNIYYKERNALNAILWSEGLTEIFKQNYQSDPSLSWQYFGSSHGILRFFPGMPWNKMETDVYDCRVKSWYIEAATCSKDVIILFDVSGSMTGFKNYVARRTLQSLLATLSNNDYVNVYTFKNDTKEVIDCFVGLVQATQENIKTIVDRLQPKIDENDELKHAVPLEGNANLTKAYIQAFDTLKTRRKSHSCDVTSTQGCNQLVMVITDYVPGNLTEVFEEHNREMVDNVTYIPVRVFTFLIGKEVTHVQEIQWMACLNRGYFVHIHSVEEVQQQVLKYINVIARPMILAGEEPPPTWTHANIDYTRTTTWNVSGPNDLAKPDEDKLVTSVAIPAFDYKHNEESNDAILLGVAGTDVPIDSIAKLAQPHQLGVNGYPLIVSNNGYLLLHPLLIATINGKLQNNYNSVDFVEVEQVDDGKGSRELGPEIKLLRKYLVDGKDGNMTDVPMLFHYDNMRRIVRVYHDYFFNELKGTPFSMGISLPKGYGDTELMLKDNPLEAKQGKELTGINVTDYFRFSYRVHPDWVYCKYHYLEGHEAENSEIEIWRFLVLISRNEIDITRQQYTEEKESEIFTYETHCGSARKQLLKDDYYCTEDLVKQLVFDAKLTTPYFKEWHATDSEWELAQKYNVSVRFIATSSGLTRWHYIFDEGKNEYVHENGTREKGYEGDVFGDKYHNAIEETWYKAAVLQHMKNKENPIVVATRLPVLDETIENPPPVENEDGDITITASFAIFYKDGQYETPASVVGFQFSYFAFYERFMEIIRTPITQEKEFMCGANTSYSCFVVDSSGYIVLSAPQNTSYVGKFFGAVDIDTQLVMQRLYEREVFDRTEVFNYQALCPISLLKESRGWSLNTPFSMVGNLLKWLLTEFMLLVINWNQSSYANDDYDIYDTADLPSTTTATPEPSPAKPPPEAMEETFSCDRSIMLYILNQKMFLDNMGVPRTVHEDTEGECHPPFWASYVAKTNMLLVVVQRGNWDYAEGCPRPRDTTPLPTADSTTSREPCHKLNLGNLERRPLEGCYTYHENEKNIKACGLGSISRSSLLLLQCAVLATLFSSYHNIQL